MRGFRLAWKENIKMDIVFLKRIPSITTTQMRGKNKALDLRRLRITIGASLTWLYPIPTTSAAQPETNLRKIIK